MQFRSRNCDSPRPEFGGRYCIGSSEESRKCNENIECPGLLRKLVCFTSSLKKGLLNVYIRFKRIPYKGRYKLNSFKFAKGLLDIYGIVSYTNNFEKEIDSEQDSHTSMPFALAQLRLFGLPVLWGGLLQIDSFVKFLN